MDLPIANPGLETLSVSDCYARYAVAYCVGAGILLLISVLTMRTHCHGPLTACKSNCKNLATALEMYASDNHGQYPDGLESLIPGNYLKSLPTCPSAQAMSYTDYYAFNHRTNFRFSCVGNNHGKAYAGFKGDSTNYPAYDANQGLLDHP